MFDHKKLLDELLVSKNGLEVDSIHFISDEVFLKAEKEKLAAVGLESYETIYFSAKGSNYPEKKQPQSLPNMWGATICIRNDLDIKQVIFLQKETRKEINSLPDYQDDWKSMVQLCALFHELGHVEDMQKNINFSFTGEPTVKIIEAEAYAHTYALNNLNRAGATIARNTLAAALYKLNTSKINFEKRLYQQICSSIGKGRIKKWVNA